MEQLKVIRLVTDRLEKLGTPYFITGSIASSYYGIPRYTHDLDVVITISEEDIRAIMRLFEHEGYLSQEGIRDALSGTGMFNFIHIESGLKVDFWIDRESRSPNRVLKESGRSKFQIGCWLKWPARRMSFFTRSIGTT